MTWKIRHEGSPRAIEGLTSTQVVEGLQDGLWEPSDEVMGPQDHGWSALESHPQFAESAADIEPRPPRHREDETRLDMNPLIDVCLVLLIFFILTTSYAALQKVLDLPGTTSKNETGPPEKTEKEVDQFMIRVEAREENGTPVIKVENQVVDLGHLVAELSNYVRSQRKTEILLDASGVDWGTIVAIQDAAKGADIKKVHYLVQREEVQGAR
jgi:biopolymer transport protein ExbD